MQFLLSSLSFFFSKHLFVFSKPFEQKHNLCHFGCCIWCFVCICCPGGNVRFTCGYVEKLHSLKCVGCSNVFYDSKLTVSVFGLCE